MKLTMFKRLAVLLLGALLSVQALALTPAQAKWWSAPKASLTLNFCAGLDPRITFTRASTGTYVGADGLIATASTNVPRVQYSSAGVCQGLLVEEARTNLALWSRDFTNAAWTKSSMTAALTATGADGAANSASTLTATAGNATALQAITSGSAARISGVWIKRRTGSGTVNVTQDNGTTWTAVTVTASWSLVSIPAATLANPTVGIRIVSNGDAVDVDYFQQEVGSTVSSAIPTTSATVTRSADSVSMPFVPGQQGTIVAVASSYVQASGSVYSVLGLTDGASNNILRMFEYNGNWGISVANGNVSQADIQPAAYTQNVSATMAFAFAPNDFSAAVNGTLGTRDTAGTVPVTNTLSIGFHPNGNYLNGTIRSIRIYPRRLPDTMLQGLTRQWFLPFILLGWRRRRAANDERFTDLEAA